MANVLADLFQDIADAIRAKTGSSAKMPPASFPEEIAGISTSGDFDSIDKTLDEINGEVVGENLCYVTFIGADGTELHKEPVYEGYSCPDPVSTGVIATPTKESTKYETFTYSGWSLTEGGTASSTVLKVINADRTVYAAFTAKKIYIAQGSCGDTANWTLDPDYALVISGSGAMTRYTGSTLTGVADTPWWDYHDQITTLDVKSGITEIGDYSFFGCSSLTRASLPSTLSSVSAIGYSAFQGCVALVDVNIPSAVFYIQSETFYGCASLQSIEIPAKVFAISADAFSKCANLTSVSIGTPEGWSLYASNDTIVETYTTAQMSDPAQAANILVNNTYQTGEFKRPNS